MRKAIGTALAIAAMAGCAEGERGCGSRRPACPEGRCRPQPDHRCRSGSPAEGRERLRLLRVADCGMRIGFSGLLDERSEEVEADNPQSAIHNPKSSAVCGDRLSIFRTKKRRFVSEAVG